MKRLQRMTSRACAVQLRICSLRAVLLAAMAAAVTAAGATGVGTGIAPARAAGTAVNAEPLASQQQPPQPLQALQPQELDAKFSCSAEHAADRLRDGDRRLVADSGAFQLRGDAIVAFYWESSVFRSNHGADCSIDEGDDLVAEALPPQDGTGQRWRISLRDGRAARTRRGYDADHGVNCSIRLTQVGAQLQIVPSCPALCGSRENFSQLTVDLRTGNCAYER